MSQYNVIIDSQFAVLKTRKLCSPKKPIDMVEMRMLRLMCGVTREDEIRNETADNRREWRNATKKITESTGTGM